MLGQKRTGCRARGSAGLPPGDAAQQPSLYTQAAARDSYTQYAPTMIRINAGQNTPQRAWLLGRLTSPNHSMQSHAVPKPRFTSAVSEVKALRSYEFHVDGLHDNCVWLKVFDSASRAGWQAHCVHVYIVQTSGLLLCALQPLL
mmetsp:Transcript_49707/g.144196  ORF Transcript_49707/g.144196 Transcript_49707/m.144196 type:complete len:144 (-) Transcript_49707:9-440(-)